MMISFKKQILKKKNPRNNQDDKGLKVVFN